MINRRQFLATAGTLCAACTLTSSAVPRRPRNVALITLDDMNWDSLGVTGCRIPGISPHLDRFASESVRFDDAYIMTSICGPSRNAMMTGRFPHCSGSMGHGKQPPAGWQAPDVPTPSLSTLLHGKGFFTGAILKSGRLIDTTFDMRFGEGPMGCYFEDRDPPTFYKRTKAVLDKAKAAGKPFFLYANPIDPHRPFPRTKMEADLCARYREEQKDRVPKPNIGPGEPDTQYAPEEIDLPKFLPDIPAARAHVAPYFDAVHRGDQCVGAILRALEDCGAAEDTLVIFLSDHGMGVPGAKWSSYNYSLRTPLMVRWPGVAEPGAVVDGPVVSSIDIMPTVLQALGLPPVEGLEGRSLVPFLLGRQPKTWRKSVYAAFNWMNDSKPDQYYPIRVETDGTYMYIWNAYLDAEDAPKQFHYAGHELVQLMLRSDDPKLHKRAETFIHRPVQELYNIEKDPGCWENLAEGFPLPLGTSIIPEWAIRMQALQTALLMHMKDTRDPLTGMFEAWCREQGSR